MAHALQVCMAALVVGAWAWGPTPGFPNQLGATPLMGWRSWSAYAKDVDQALMLRQIDGLAQKRRVLGGAPMSLADVGYTDVGLDGGYWLRGGGINGSCHDADHHMVIDTLKFPNLTQMNERAHQLNLTTSWYLNVAGCDGSKEPFTTYTTDAMDAVRYGFDGVKFDHEGSSKTPNITKWAEALNATGKQMMIENCLDKHPQSILDTPQDCPFNFYRSGPDNSPSFHGGIYHVYNYTVDYLHTTVRGVPASRPGCWAYADILGIGTPIAGTRLWNHSRAHGCVDMTFDEETTLFANWAIVSSPLVLAIDVGDDQVVNKYWPIITNARLLALHREWAGEAGRLLRMSEQTDSFIGWTGAGCEKSVPVNLPVELVYSKRLLGGRAAVLVINVGNVTRTGSAVSYDEVLIATGYDAMSAPSSFSVMDVWTGDVLQEDVDPKQPWHVPPLGPHASVFAMFSASSGAVAV